MEYLSLAELEILVKQLATPAELISMGWWDLSVDAKQVYLDRAVAMFESLKFLGVKQNSAQPLLFPRTINGVFVDINSKIKKAIAHIVLSELKLLKSPRLLAIKQGVDAVAIGSYRESYKDKQVSRSLVDDFIVQMYLKSYVFNGVLQRV